MRHLSEWGGADCGAASCEILVAELAWICPRPAPFLFYFGRCGRRPVPDPPIQRRGSRLDPWPDPLAWRLHPLQSYRLWPGYVASLHCPPQKWSPSTDSNIRMHDGLIGSPGGRPGFRLFLRLPVNPLRLLMLEPVYEVQGGLGG